MKLPCLQGPYNLNRGPMCKFTFSYITVCCFLLCILQKWYKSAVCFMFNFSAMKSFSGSFPPEAGVKSGCKQEFEFPIHNLQILL